MMSFLRVFLRVSLIACVASVILVAMPRDAAAQNGDAEARDLFRAGEAAYSQGRYEAALERFREAHALSGRDLLLFNIGQCLDRLRRDDEALETFEQYLTSEPEGPHHIDVQRRVVALRRAIAERHARDDDEERARRDAAASASRASTTPPTDTATTVVDEWWFWTLIGAASVAVVVPIVVVTTSSGGPTPIAGDFGPDGVIVALEISL